MAILDTQNNQIVIRLLYDGPPMSGKTTSLKTLASSFSREMYTPEETDGRTLYFDWLEYTGGLFEGSQIRCQLVSVPGQPVLAPRRQRLLESADAVIFVGDTTRPRIDESLTYLKGLTRVLKTLPGPPVGIIFQANKRDQSDAVEMAEIKKRFNKDLKGVGIIESVATEGTGIRQAFVFGVRLSLDRVREYIRTQSLPQGEPEIANGQELLHSLKLSERSPLLLHLGAPSSYHTTSSTAQVPIMGGILPGVMVAESEDNYDAKSDIQVVPLSTVLSSPQIEDCDDEKSAFHQVPHLPSAEIQAGLIWPPVEGRIILHEATSPNLVVESLANGDWTVNSPTSWQFHSYQNAVYADLNQARQALLKWAHLHLAIMHMLSLRRSLAVAESGDGQWRLWQILYKEKSLRETLADALCENQFGRIADGIWGVAYLFVTAAQKFTLAHYEIPYTLDNLSYADSIVYYNGLVPDTSTFFPAQAQGKELQITEIVKEHIGPLLVPALAQKQEQIPDIVDYLCRRADHSPRSQAILETLCNLIEASPG